MKYFENLNVLEGLAMKVVLQDLHLCDETSGYQNPPRECQEEFFHNLREVISKVEPKNVVFVFNGDIYEFLSTALWRYEIKNGKYIKREINVRPWSKDETAKILTGERAKEILQAIFRQPLVHSFHQDLRSLLEELKNLGIKNKVIFISSNHDRLVFSFPQLQEMIKEIFGNSARVLFLDEFLDKNLGLYCSHGHQYDPYNFSENHKTPIGDAVEIEIFCRIPIEVYLQTGNLKLMSKVAGFEHTRPQEAAFIFLEKIFKEANLGKEFFSPLMMDIAKECLNIDFVKSYFARNPSFLKFRISQILLLVKFIKLFVTGTGIERTLTKLAGDSFRKFTRFIQDYNKLQRSQISKRSDLKDFKYFVFGHSHNFEVSAFEDRPRFYINLGSWQPKHYLSGKEFLRLRKPSYAIFYDKEEIKKVSLPEFEIFHKVIYEKN